MFAKGVTVNGVKYTGVKADSRSIYATSREFGVVIVRTNKTIIIGYYNGNKQPGPAAKVVEDFADYVIKNGY
ncbi:hypothetical protein BG452_13550 [Streptomyces sp. CBMA123]|nr:hypothetical protein [Streptomyces sp. CBMA123]